MLIVNVAYVPKKEKVSFCVLVCDTWVARYCRRGLSTIVLTRSNESKCLGKGV